MNLMAQQTLTLTGAATLPSSKSQSIRGLFFGLLAKGQSSLLNVLHSEDVYDAIRVCQDLGAVITQNGSEIIIESTGLPLINTTGQIYSGNSGITTQFALPLLGYRLNSAAPLTFNCGEQMRARPIRPLADALQNLGLHIQYSGQAGSCPITVKDRLQGGQTQVDGLSSQYLSALLIALPCAEQDSEITVIDLHERPYAAMTLNWLQTQGIEYHHQYVENTDIFNIPGRQRYKPFQKILTGDFSSASYLLAAGALLGKPLELYGLDMHDSQGDKRMVEILRDMGADMTVEAAKLTLRGGKPLTGICIDANDIPDLLPTLAVIGAQASGKTSLINVKQARIKETDRIHSITQGLRRMGARIDEYEDGMTIYSSRLTGAHVQGFGDHRTVMALAVAGLLAEGQTVIDTAESIDKTFPTFIKMLQSLGAKLERDNDQ